MSIDKFDAISTEGFNQSFENRYTQRKLTTMQQPNIGRDQSFAPLIAPPNFTPPLPPWRNGYRGIRGCINRNTYLWLVNGNSFWFYPTYVGRRAIIGFRWRGYGWAYQRIILDRIRAFQCF